MTYRVGRSLGRTIYEVLGGDPKDDRFAGIMETPALAEMFVDAVNFMGAPPAEPPVCSCPLIDASMPGHPLFALGDPAGCPVHGADMDRLIEDAKRRAREAT